MFDFWKLSQYRGYTDLRQNSVLEKLCLSINTQQERVLLRYQSLIFYGLPHILCMKITTVRVKYEAIHKISKIGFSTKLFLCCVFIICIGEKKILQKKI